MKIFIDFKCSNGHTTEKLIDNKTREIECPVCSEIASKVISPVRSLLDPISGDFVGATMKWARDREKKIQKERKANS
jgi:DNA-directed RNA polymerase subunit RPC12/RpoP